MNYTGISRPIDKLGRIVLPVELRRSLNWNHRDLINISLDEDNQRIFLVKAIDTCFCCNSVEDLTTIEVDIYTDKFICSNCLGKANESSKVGENNV